MSERFTASRVPGAGIAALFTTQARWQAWLRVEAALAQTQAELGVIPAAAAAAIAAECRLESLEPTRVQQGIARSSHPLTPLVTELGRVVGEPHGGWVHWGVTTQNITQTGDILILKQVHSRILKWLGRTLQALAELAERSADMTMAGRTHGQHAVPLTFGLKVASWIDEYARHVTRLHELEPRVFRAIVGGAAGTFASLGETATAVQAGVAQKLGLAPMSVPARSTLDHLAEFVCVLGLLGTTCGKLAREIYTLMKTEYGEAEEPVPPGTIGSSTMPQKRNPQLSQDVLRIAAELRALVPLALEAAQSEHEADHTPSLLIETIWRAAGLTGELLTRVQLIVSELQLSPERMLANLELSGGLISAEAVMLELGKTIGRQHAHEVIYDAAQAAATQSAAFAELLAADPRVTAHLSRSEITALLDPKTHTGLAATIAHEQAAVARRLAAQLRSGDDEV